MHATRRLRLQKGLTQKELALVGRTSQPTLAAYETGVKSPTLDTLSRLAASVGFEVAVSFVPPLTREDRRSLAYHAAIATKLREAPGPVLAKARAHLSVLRRRHPHARALLQHWQRVLDLTVDEIVSCLLDPSLLARDLRQVTPFAGLLTSAERAKILAEFRKEERR